MASETDVCPTCSSIFDDIKCAIKCNGCEKYFHGPCEGVPNLKGFHMKRATWKCQKCMSSETGVPEAGNSRKRHRSQNGDVIEIDRMELATLLETIKTLSQTVAGMEVKLDALYEQNVKLSSLVSSFIDKPPTASAITSFSAITKQNTKRVPPVKTNNNTPAVEPVTPAAKKIPPRQDAPQVMTSNENTEFEFQPSKPRKKRPMKPLIIGSVQGSSSEQASVTQLTGSERRHWIYVGRTSASTTTDTVIQHVKSTWKIDDIQCVQLSKREEHSSFKVGVRESFIPSLLDAAKWPKYVAIREFVQFSRRSPTGERSAAGNFPMQADTKTSS